MYEQTKILNEQAALVGSAATTFFSYLLIPFLLAFPNYLLQRTRIEEIVKKSKSKKSKQRQFTITG